MIRFGLLLVLLGLAHSMNLPKKSLKISQDLSRTSFFLYTPENGVNNPIQFEFGASGNDLLAAGFHPERSTKILSHGWNSDGLGFCREFVEAYFSSPEHVYNIICLHWQPLATWDNYFIAAANAVQVGRHAGENLAKILIRQIGQHPDQIHAIGHSLGGHLVGHLGRTMESFGGKGKISRATALDPAGPYFDVMKEKRVTKNDAKLVDVIHTNSGTIVQLCLSLKDPLGHIDFYPNGGSHQEGCNDVCFADICSESNLIDLLKGACSHGRVKDLYVESIYESFSGPAFLSKKCDSWSDFEANNCYDDVEELQMGEALGLVRPSSKVVVSDEPQMFFLSTQRAAPFSHD